MREVLLYIYTRTGIDSGIYYTTVQAYKCGHCSVRRLQRRPAVRAMHGNADDCSDSSDVASWRRAGRATGRAFCCAHAAVAEGGGQTIAATWKAMKSVSRVSALPRGKG